MAESDQRTAAMVEVDGAWQVRTLSDVLRNASDSLGWSYLRTAGSVWPLAANELARLVAYEEVQTVVGAALKLSPFDPSRTVAWAVEAEREVERLVAATAGLTVTGQIPAYGVPQVEERGRRHADTERRLFRA